MYSMLGCDIQFQHSHNYFTYIKLHYLQIFEHVTQPLSLHLIICQDKVQDIKGRYNYIHNWLFTKGINIPSLSRQNYWFERGTDAITVFIRHEARIMCTNSKIAVKRRFTSALVVKCQVLVCLVKDLFVILIYCFFARFCNNLPVRFRIGARLGALTYPWKYKCI